MSFRLKFELKRLCCNNGWSYGVFWRFHCRNALLLTLEDAYYGEQMVLVIDKMLPRVHVLGEGIVGQAAFTGKHHWLLSDAFFGERRSKGHVAGQNIYQVQDNSEFHDQFTSGIKTIAVIPVAPQGVVLFGSTEKILERPEFVNHIRSLFRQIDRSDGLIQSGNALADSSGEFYDSYSNYGNIEPLHDDSCKEWMGNSYSSSTIHEPASFIPQRYHGNMSTLIDDQYHLQRQHNMAGVGAQVILSKPSLQLPKVIAESCSSCTDKTFGRHQPKSSVSGESSAITSFERPSLCASGMYATPSTSSATLNSPASSKNTSVDSQRESNFLPLGSMSRSQDLASNNKISGCGLQELVDIQSLTHLTHSTVDELPEVLSSFPAFTGVSRSCNTTEAICEPNLANNLSQLDVSPLGQKNDGLALPSLDNSFQQSVVLPGDILNQAVMPATNTNSCGAIKGNSSNVPMHPPENELFDSLGLNFGNFQNRGSWDDVILPLQTGGCPTFSTGISEPISDVVLQKNFFSECALENMLNDVVCKVNSVTKPSREDSITTTVRTGSTSGNWNQIQLAGLSCLGGNDVMLPEYDDNLLRTQEEIVAKSQVASWIDDSYSINTDNATVTQPKRTEEPSKVTKKRARPGETTRPRPRDRQQIQDRIKELREIVPNGAKCSIDALLDQTIKHMLFLQSVTKYAGQLKKADEPQMIGDENCVIMKDNLSGGGSGATWAFEVGGQTSICPIIVEDLSPPGQMLIEMLCEERGFFLEIADMIRNLGLTILKGVIEAREDKLWARFITEANKEITRMDIFLSLVWLLQQTVGSRAGSGSQLT